MSLINEALKKAQRLRNEDAADLSASSPNGGGHVARRGKPDSANTLVLIGSGALVLVVLSVVFTVFLVNRPAKSPQVAAVTPAPTAKKASSVPTVNEPATPAFVTPAIVAPTITPPPSTPANKELTNPTPGLITVPPSRAATPSAPVAPAVAVTLPSIATPATTVPPTSAVNAPVVPAANPAVPTLAPDAPDERVAAFVEAVRVTGIRSSGAESRVLMNERVYRVNDIVERTMNVRLIKAEAGALTFADARGVTYVKRI